MLKNFYIATIVFIGLCFVLITGDFVAVGKQAKVTGVNVENFESVVVLELFTSQGCSSCPPADALLQKVKEDFESEVYALSYHVDYWNYIGWEDPFSHSKFSERQRQYNIKFKNKSNYTPQLVVNGKEHFVGSDASKIYPTIGTYRRLKAENAITLLNMVNDKDRIAFDYKIEGPAKGKRLRILLVLDERVTQVKRGENKNRSLKNSNIVVAESEIVSITTNGSVAVDIPKLVNANEKISLIVLMEKENLDIVGASKLNL